MSPSDFQGSFRSVPQPSVKRRIAAVAVLFSLLAVPSAWAQPAAGKIDPDGLSLERWRELMPEYFHPTGGNPRVTPMDLPDVFGPGAVLRVGNIHMKVTNWGHCGNLFTQLSSDPAGQWPGSSAVEYLSSIRLAVAAVNPTATDPNAIRRVSYLQEWRPETLEPEDRIYRTYDGAINATRHVNDDGDKSNDQFGCEIPPCEKIDEDFLDGRDNDRDGAVDEDFGALGQEMYSAVMWDNTIQAINFPFNEKHVPLGLECRQRAWAYSVSGFQDFNVVEWEIFNRSGGTLDSIFIGGLVDMDAGPVEISSFFNDDFDVPSFPQGDYSILVGSDIGTLVDPLRRQHPHDSELNSLFGPNGADSALCPRVNIRINGFSLIDDNGDEAKTPGIASLLLVSHTTDPTGESAPRKVGFKAYRSFVAGTPYAQGGFPIVDAERFAFLAGYAGTNVDEEGFINALPGDQKGDYISYWSAGPWRTLPDDASVKITIAFAVFTEEYTDITQWPQRYEQYKTGSLTGAELMEMYPPLRNAFNLQLAYEGVHEKREGFGFSDFQAPNYHGRESKRQVTPGGPPQYLSDCRDIELGRTRQVTDREPTWFDFDCDFCTGVWDYELGAGDFRNGGLFHKNWNAEAPPPNPAMNVGSAYNYTDNAGRSVIPSGDNQITLAWNNLSEVTPDPKSGWFDFRGYRLWKVSDWTRPVGSAGPAEADWTLIGEFRQFRYYDANRAITTNRYYDSVAGDTVCPRVFIPNYYNPTTGRRDSATVDMCLERGDLWDRQSGQIIRPDRNLPCQQDTLGNCVTAEGCIVGRSPCTAPSNQETITQYPVGYYQYLDREVKNGFLYFYSVTAFDSTTELGRTTELGGRRSAVEAEGVAPQVSTSANKSVWVVPNPYRGYANISDRPSSWDLTPNASDPTGTHIDFMGLPAGRWTIRIYTVSGDLVQELHSEDAVNESVRPPLLGADGNSVPGYNRQQDYANDGQARWNLISRNGQDIVSGIYMFTVESGGGMQRGRFVVIR
jgi:hypothetical protein